MLLASLSAAQKAGIAGMGAAFIVFALVSSFVVPRYRPNFPGKRVWPYVGLAACFFVAMIVVVVFVGREKSEAAAVTTAPTSTSPSPGPPPPAVKGDPAAGKAVFLSSANACGSCHTFTPAGSTGEVGPDLDKLAADAQVASRGSLVQYTTESIISPNAYIVPKYSAGVMTQDFGTKLSKKQIQDLVAFLLKPA